MLLIQTHNFDFFHILCFIFYSVIQNDPFFLKKTSIALGDQYVSGIFPKVSQKKDISNFIFCDKIDSTPWTIVSF